MKASELAELLRAMAFALGQYDEASRYHNSAPLISRGREVAEQIGTMRKPSDDEIMRVFNDGYDRCDHGARILSGIHAVLSRFGGVTPD